MATHSSILAWRIPWTREPCGPQFIWLQKVEHAWSDSTHALTKGISLSAYCLPIGYFRGFPCGSDGKESEMEYLDSIPGPGRSSEGGNLSIFAWRIPWRGAWGATVHGVAELDKLSD